jgi:alkylated DNA nucleotide flippase Atl1
VAAVPDLAERVLAVVDRIPPGKVLSYGDIAEEVGTRSPRQVGRVMSRYGDDVPWHRVVMADGRPAACHAREQLALLRGDGTPLVADGTRVDMPRARWDFG